MKTRVRSTAIALVMATSTAAGVVTAGVAVAATCPPAPAADTSTASGWIGYLAAHPRDYGLIVTDGDRVTLSHNADRRFPTASASKLINLAAYTQAVATGAVRPEQTVTVNEWERWYVPIDGDAHVKALRYLKFPPLSGVPGTARPASLRVSLAQLADVMIRFSDSAAPDALRAVLGDARLSEVMRRYGLTGPPPLNAGLYLGLIDPTLTSQARQQAAGRRYHDDAAYRAAAFYAAPRLAGSVTDAQVERSYSQTTRGLNALMRAVATGSFGVGSKQARRVLEFQGPQPDGSVLGFKGGSLKANSNSVITDNFELRTGSGSVTTATLMVRGLSAADFDKDLDAGLPHQQVLVAAMTDEDTVALLRCVRGRGAPPH